MKKPFEDLFARYDRLVVFDTETTGLRCSWDEIIEFAAAAVECRDGVPEVTETYDELIALSPGGFVPAEIQKLTGITDADLREKGISKEQICRDIGRLFSGNTLLLAYNAHFDLSFLYYLLLRGRCTDALRGKDKLDLLTVYRDRHSYPHRLCSAIETYGLAGKVVNSHRAIDDVLATVAVMEAMDREKPDLASYINLFGYNPKFGVEGKAIRSVTYRPQPYHPARPLYETV